ncbi:36194_t:CDS:2, partial [Racocetra persica]
ALKILSSRNSAVASRCFSISFDMFCGPLVFWVLDCTLVAMYSI